MTSTDVPPGSPLTEADIQAYADGTLKPERAAFLRDYLGKDPGEARRVAFYDRLNTQIQQAFQSADEPPATRRVDGSHRTLLRMNPTGRRRGPLITVVVLVLTLAAASGWLAATQVSAQALDNAAVMALAETAARPFSTATPTRTAAAAPDLSAIGLRLVEQRVVPQGPFQRVNEFIYLNGDTQPIVLMSTLTLFATAQPQWSARRIGAIRLLTWTAHGQRFVVAGDARTHGLMRAADALTMH
ncbi:Predicted transmembrane transcriptional regulator (Anti-sigma factor) [Paraburkholderia ribeironis]|uniref:Predicted transmembrane transcriptional regulator (Anti-sigma factor) n=1 Tax=Paraburkholderia ribeironis TaxID=1247936 RepID=A0A1N7RX73_9BURK|nr:transcriptional regulator [Paraburkholderia ribeironis]SIT39730.1 Predicted transmembrane transcriptional regulator (Anti-sigma factor) [Paraburkholderia ribeironis]